MKFALNKIVLFAFLLTLVPGLSLLSWTDYRTTKSELEQNFNFMVGQTGENIVGAYKLVEISYKILSQALEADAINAFKPFSAAYENAGGKIEDIDLESIKSELGDDWDLYIIDDAGIVVATTFAKDKGLDFSKFGDFNNKLQEIRKASRYQGDRVANETLTGQVRKYAYLGTPDKKYILEVGLKSAKFEQMLKELDLSLVSKGFLDFNPDLRSVQIFNSDGEIYNLPDFVATDRQISDVKSVYTTGVKIDYLVPEQQERHVYLFADVDDDEFSASHGDKAIELVFSTKQLSDKLADLARNQIIITVSFIAIGTLVALLLALRVSKPIAQLTLALDAIAAGDLGHRIPESKGTLEVEKLTDGLKAMVGSIKDKISEITSTTVAYERFVPKQFLTLLRKQKITEVVIGNSSSLEMSVLFADMRNFTSISEKLTADETFKLLNGYLEILIPAIGNNGGFIDKYIGDAVMALFNTKAESAVKAAVDMNKGLAEWNRKHAKSGRNEIGMGVGIHFGNLVLGTIGQADRMDTTVISDTVNVASRLEALTKTYGAKILISEKVYATLPREMHEMCRLVDCVRVKGKSEELNIFEVFAADDDDTAAFKIDSRAEFESLVRSSANGGAGKALAGFKALREKCEQDSVVDYWIERLAC